MKRLTIILLMMYSAAAQAQSAYGGVKTYRVTAYKKGNNQITSVSNYSDVVPPQHIYLPNAFTPNNDGINDTFGAKGEGIQNYHIIIFNRWGEVVFESTNPAIQWDGKFKGEQVQTGTYTYEVFVKGFEAVPKTGSVTVMR